MREKRNIGRKESPGDPWSGRAYPSNSILLFPDPPSNVSRTSRSRPRSPTLLFLFFSFSLLGTPRCSRQSRPTSKIRAARLHDRTKRCYCSLLHGYHILSSSLFSPRCSVTLPRSLSRSLARSLSRSLSFTRSLIRLGNNHRRRSDHRKKR